MLFLFRTFLVSIALFSLHSAHCLCLRDAEGADSAADGAKRENSIRRRARDRAVGPRGAQGCRVEVDGGVGAVTNRKRVCAVVLLSFGFLCVPVAAKSTLFFWFLP